MILLDKPVLIVATVTHSCKDPEGFEQKLHHVSSILVQMG